MGWVRNYHGYQFFDRRDGAAWGPEDSGAIDMMHMAMNGFDYLDDRKTHLAEILQVTFLLPLLLLLLPRSMEHVGLVTFDKYGFDCLAEQEDHLVLETLLALFLSFAACTPFWFKHKEYCFTQLAMICTPELHLLYQLGNDMAMFCVIGPFLPAGMTHVYRQTFLLHIGCGLPLNVIFEHMDCPTDLQAEWVTVPQSPIRRPCN